MRSAPFLAVVLLACDSSLGIVPPVESPGTPETKPEPTELTTETSTGTSSTTPPLDPEWHCNDPGDTLSFDPPHPAVGETLTVTVSSANGYPWIEFSVAQPIGLAPVGTTQIDGSGPFEWAQDYAVGASGRYDVQFTADEGASIICTGSVWAVDGSATGGTATTPGDVPPDNPFGIGLVGPGDAGQWDRAQELSGRGGHIKLIFPGIEPTTTAAEPGWIDAVQGAYDRDLVPVIRMGPPWGQMGIRNWSDDAAHRDYTTYAAAFAAVVDDLPRRGDWPIWIEVHNEPNLCYEWTCDPNETAWLDAPTIGAEYASLLRDVRDALNALGDSRIKVMNGGLAPGGVGSCECGTDNYSGGETSDAFIGYIEAEVPGIFASLDGFATHSYPSSGQGWGFFEPYSSAGPGLTWWQTEIAAAGVQNHPVLITETGWTVGAGAMGSRDDVADWTVSAWTNDWFPEPQIEAVMPFQLQDGAWNDFSWIDSNGTPYAVFDEVRDYRCSMAFPDPC